MHDLCTLYLFCADLSVIKIQTRTKLFTHLAQAFRHKRGVRAKWLQNSAVVQLGIVGFRTRRRSHIHQRLSTTITAEQKSPATPPYISKKLKNRRFAASRSRVPLTPRFQHSHAVGCQLPISTNRTCTIRANRRDTKRPDKKHTTMPDGRRIACIAVC
jgi:hypothetical protein